METTAMLISAPFVVSADCIVRELRGGGAKTHFNTLMDVKEV